MRAVIGPALVLVAVVGCRSVSEDQRFEELGRRYLEEFTALSPTSSPSSWSGKGSCPAVTPRTPTPRNERSRHGPPILQILGDV